MSRNAVVQRRRRDCETQVGQSTFSTRRAYICMECCRIAIVRTAIYLALHAKSQLSNTHRDVAERCVGGKLSQFSQESWFCRRSPAAQLINCRITCCLGVRLCVPPPHAPAIPPSSTPSLIIPDRPRLRRVPSAPESRPPSLLTHAKINP